MTSFLWMLLLAAGSEVTDSAPGGFTVTSAVEVSADAKTAFRALVQEVGSWWHPDHTWSGKAANLSIEPKAGGCFCERLEGGGSVEHLRVVYVHPGKILRLRGGLGPLQDTGVTGSLTLELAEGEEGTRITLTYKVGGYHPGGLDELAPVVDRVLAEQLDRLSKYIEGK